MYLKNVILKFLKTKKISPILFLKFPIP
ncbi:hypothetical protein FJU49_16485 [Acinetobacter baumannii]|nr:hypothetical protein FJU49_16485 [Acinetobacter baumannii]HAV4302647.1 hypothetical protein [Acinetobacter baumannii]